MNNISQHSFCPLGFLVGCRYDDSMTLIDSSSNNCTLLSPFHGSSFIYFCLGRIRAWSPLSSVSYASTDEFPAFSFVEYKKGTYSFSVSFSILLFKVFHIGF